MWWKAPAIPAIWEAGQEKDLSPEVQDQTRVTARRTTTANFREGNGVTFGHTDT